MKRVLFGFGSATKFGVASLYADVWIVERMFGSNVPYIIIALTVACILAFVGLFVTEEKAQTLVTIFGLLVGMYGGDLLRIALFEVEGRVF